MPFPTRTLAPRLLGAAGLALLAGCASWQPFGSSSPAVPGDSLTMRRVMGQEPTFTPLKPEPGDVWPGEEAPRATMANPDQLMREPTEAAAPPPLRRRGSSTYPGDQPLPEATPPARPLPRTTRVAPLPPPDNMGQSIPVPGGPPVTITGGNSGMQTYTGPGGSGVAVREGPTINLFGNDGTLRQVPAPR